MWPLDSYHPLVQAMVAVNEFHQFHLLEFSLLLCSELVNIREADLRPQAQKLMANHESAELELEDMLQAQEYLISQ